MALLDDVKSIVTVKTTGLTVDEGLLSMTVEEIQLVILNYCNIDEVPVELKFTWANMVEDQLRYYVALTTPNTSDTGSVSMGDITSLKIGDTTINVDASKNTSTANKAVKSHTANLDTIVKNYKQALNKYRRMVW